MLNFTFTFVHSQDQWLIWNTAPEVICNNPITVGYINYRQ